MREDQSPTVVHVAAAEENRGRVVLRLGAGEPNRVAVEAALRVARAYHASLESIFVEDQQLLDLAAHEGIHEVSLCGRERRSMSAAGFMRQFAFAARQAEKRIATMARLAEIPYRGRTLRDTPLHALNRACAEAGPWNVIAFADPVSSGGRADLLELMHGISGVTGFVLVAPRAQRTHGPIVIVLEDVERLPQLLRIAARLGSEAADRLVVLLAPATATGADDMEDHVRLLLGDRDDVQVVMAASVLGNSAVLAETLRRMRAGFIVGQIGRALLPNDGSWSALAQTMECPLFIAR